MKNKYGLEIIECIRGMNRTEAHPKISLLLLGAGTRELKCQTVCWPRDAQAQSARVREERPGYPEFGHYDM